MGFLTVKGECKQYSGKILFGDDMLKSISAEVLVKSINTKDASRDKTITSKGYLNTKEYPIIKFQSTSVVKEKRKDFLIGFMEIKGVKKEIKIPFKLFFLKDKKRVQLMLQTKILRKDFQLDFGSMDTLIGDKITIDLLIEGKNNQK